MRRMWTKLGSLAALAMLTLTVAQPAQAGQTGQQTDATRAAAVEPAYFEMVDGLAPHRTFIVQMTEDRAIEHARELVSGAATDRPHVIGRITKSTAPYNATWSFHLEPETIGFFDQAIEICDASLTYLEDHLDEAGGAFLPGLFYCPWDSRIVREVEAP